jgi:hypothetical protein
MRQQIGVVLVLALIALTSSVKDAGLLLAGGGKPPVTLSLPSATTVNPGDTFNLPISLTMEADSHAISIVTLVLAFDPTVLKVTDLSPAGVLPAVLESSLGTDTAGLTAGIGMNPAGAIKSSTTVATITFQAVGSGGAATPIRFTRAEAYSLSGWDEAGENVVGSTTDASITITGQSEPTTLTGDWELNYEIYRWLQSDGSTVDVDERATIVARFSAVENGFTGRYLYVSGDACADAEINGSVQVNQVNWKTHFTGPPCQGAEVVFEGTLSPDGTTMTGTVSPIRPSPDGRGAWARVTARKVTRPSVWLNYVSFPSAPHASVVGTKVTATGSGWSAGHQVNVQWEDGTELAATTVDGNGGFTVPFRPPDDAVEGQHTVSFVGVPAAGGSGYVIPATLTVVKPDIPSLNARVTELLLFESAYDPPPAEQRVYQQRFASDTSRYINWELNLEHPAPGRPIDFVITAIWYQDNGTGSWEEIFRQTKAASIEGEWTSSYHNLGYGCDDPVNCWEVGSYRVDIYVAGNMIASAPFQIYSAAL